MCVIPRSEVLRSLTTHSKWVPGLWPFKGFFKQDTTSCTKVLCPGSGLQRGTFFSPACLFPAQTHSATGPSGEEAPIGWWDGLAGKGAWH